MSMVDEKTKPNCPYCGCVLVLCNGRYGTYYACPSYPACKFKASTKKFKPVEEEKSRSRLDWFNVGGL